MLISLSDNNGVACRDASGARVNHKAVEHVQLS